MCITASSFVVVWPFVSLKRLHAPPLQFHHTSLLLAPVGSYWPLLTPTGSYWLLLPPTGLYRPLLAPTGSYCPLLAPTGSYCPLPASVGSYWLILAPVGSFWSLLASSGPYCLLLRVARLGQIPHPIWQIGWEINLPDWAGNMSQSGNPVPTVSS